MAAADYPATPSTTRKLSVAVVDNQGKFIPTPGIGLSNFRVLEGGVPQTIADFRDDGKAVAVLLEYPTTVAPHRIEIIAAATRLIDSLPPQDYVAVATFDMRLNILADFSMDRSVAHTALNQLHTPAFSESNLFDALSETENRMKALQGRKAIVVLTTGVDTFSKLTLDQARATIKAAGIPIYLVKLVTLSSRMQTPQTFEIMQALAADAGGRAFFSNSSEQDATALSSISAELRGYEISYRTSQARPQGASNVTVELVNAQTSGPLRLLDNRGAEVPYRIIVTPMP
jgi:Ca-activated chloride channel homolog